jgi:hypothetical protein
MKFRCLIDGYEWITTPGCILSGQGCSKCVNRYRRTEPEFISEIYEINPNLKILGKYINTGTKIQVECLLDGYIWEATPSWLIRGVGCPRCAGVEKYTTDIFIEKFKLKNPEIEIVGEYVNVDTKIEVKCLVDGQVWFPTPRTLWRGSGCPRCNSYKGEKKLYDYLSENKIEYAPQYFFSELRGFFGMPLRFDCAIFNKKELYVIVEIDGIGHRKPIKFRGMSEENAIEKYNLIKKYDELKNDYCKKHNIRLIRIEYDGKHLNPIIETLERWLSPLLRKEEN